MDFRGNCLHNFAMASMRRDDVCPRPDPIVTGTHPMPAGRSVWRASGITDWLLKFTADGQARFGFADGSGDVVSRAGELVLVKPQARHDYGTIGTMTWRMIWAVFDPPVAWAPLLDLPTAGPGVLRLRIDDEAVLAHVSAKLHEMHTLATAAAGSQRKYLRLAMNALEGALLWCDTLRPTAADERVDPRLQRAIDHVRTHLGECLDLTQLCAVAGLSTAQLGRLFARHLNVTPQAFVERERLARARQLLEHTALPVQSIASEVGFESPFYFARRFRLRNGIAPSAYRNRVR